MRIAKALIRLGGCPGWSESSLGAYAILLVLSRGGSYVCAFYYRSCWEPWEHYHCLQTVSMFDSFVNVGHFHEENGVQTVTTVEISSCPLIRLGGKWEKKSSQTAWLPILSWGRGLNVWNIWGNVEFRLKLLPMFLKMSQNFSMLRAFGFVPHGCPFQKDSCIPTAWFWWIKIVFITHPQPY